jgi:hypothetical protein
MTCILIPANKLDDWRRLLADPEHHWQNGYSTKRLAQAWLEADGFPPAVSRVLHLSGHDLFRDMEILLAVPEYRVPLPGGGTASTNDLFVLAKSRGQLTTFVIEGKVNESFGPTVSEWLREASKGKKTRLEYICSTLGLTEARVADIHYRLLNRTASALIEARRFNATNAVMFVQSFSETYAGSDDFVAFAKLYGLTPEPNRLHFIGHVDKIRLFLGWIADI